MNFPSFRSFALIFTTFCSMYTTAYAQRVPTAATLGSKSYILMEASTGTVLTQHLASERMEPASITKLMTAYVVYQSIAQNITALDEKFPISALARSMEGSRMFVEQGDSISVDNLLNGLVIQSGNDAAVALAEGVAGDVDTFVEIMNQQAAALGMKNSQFQNVSGLPEAGHYMSAYDIALLAQAIIRDFPEHYQRYRQRSFTWNNIKQNNRNTLLRTNKYVDGLKTGHTNAAGYCLAASAEKNNMRLISIVLGTESAKARAKAANKLLAYGFTNFSLQKLYVPGQKIALAAVENGLVDTVGVSTNNSLTLPLPIVKPTQGLQAKLALTKKLEAPLNKGSAIGNIVIYKNGVELASIPAVTIEGVEEIGFFQNLWRNIVTTVTEWVK